MYREPSGACARCEALPEAVAGPGRLFLWFPLRHTLSQVLHHLKETGRSHQALPGGDGLAVALDGGEAAAFAGTLAGILGPEGENETRALWVQGPGEPGLGDFPRVVSLRRFAASVRAEWLRDMLAERRITSHFQPIVETGDTSSVFGYEALLRGIEDKTTLPPDRIFAAARDAGLLFQLDLAARQSAIREAVRHGLDARIFINFAPNSIYDPAFCLRTTVGAVREAGLPADRIVFEVIESEQVTDLGHLEAILTVYRQSGFQVALDDLGAGYSSLSLMSRLRPDFVKFDKELIRGVDQDAYKAVVAGKLLELARQLGIRTVAEGVESRGEYEWLRGHGADYVQGYLIAAPAAPPARGIPRL